ncbi:YtxH domain-containing protein [Salinicoccus halitifaciens]|uniref:Gas vesicle protein n=1 Tax=Salinicoccus halitifaciens TaxID=1073415 RepID=A0ABV2E6C1_9STAP|nr:YtxH domain-containing protein [Salinicoccus halitifaciens]MCD2137310.1 YtxH domain-containing protein [Salinicoccus halitifaciens]
MKLKNIAVGFLVGVTGGALVSMLNAPKSGSELQQSLKEESGNFKSQMNQVKIEANAVKSSFLKTKHESQEVFSSLGDEIKTMISNFQADINPNIENIQNHVDNLSNRGEEISKTAGNITSRKKK